jgi:hypothetical protein
MLLEAQIYRLVDFIVRPGPFSVLFIENTWALRWVNGLLIMLKINI